MVFPAMSPERRRNPRVNLTGLAYISFDPGNGGIVLNVSEEGLCFHAVTSVQRSAALPFSLSANGNSVEAVGLLAWTDEDRKTGGLRFNGLAPEARRLIRVLIDQSSRPPAKQKERALPTASIQRRPEGASKRVPAVASAFTSVLSQYVRVPLRWGDFSRGLAVGLLIAVLVAGGFSVDVRRRQIGGFLIRLGERLEVASQRGAVATVASAPAPPPATSSADAAASHSAVSLESKPAMPATLAASLPPTTLRAENPPPQPSIATRSRGPNLASPTPVPIIVPSSTGPLLSAATPNAAPPPLTATSALPLDSLASQPPPAFPANAPNVIAKAADQPGANEDAEDVVEVNSGVPLGKYFGLGKFKDELAAYQMERTLTDLRYRATVLPKSLLWMKSYQVLVGPYRNPQDADVARRSLQSQGYNPRSLPEHTRQLTLTGAAKDLFNASSTERGADNLIVTWEAYSAQATVKFVKSGEASGTVVGRWVKLPTPSPYSAIVYKAGEHGKRTLLSIQFIGMRQQVMLPPSADHGIVF